MGNLVTRIKAEHVLLQSPYMGGVLTLIFAAVDIDIMLRHKARGPLQCVVGVKISDEDVRLNLRTPLWWSFI